MDWFLSRALSHVFAVIFCLSIYWTSAEASVTQNPKPGCDLNMKQCMFDYEYYQEGHIIIGGLFTVNTVLLDYDYENLPIMKFKLCAHVAVMEYRNLVGFLWIIDEINKNPDILPNITLGYHIYDSCGNAMNAIKHVLQILSGNKREAPNYSCRKQGKVAGFIGDSSSITSLPMAQIMGVYGYTQQTRSFYPAQFIFHRFRETQVELMDMETTVMFLNTLHSVYNDHNLLNDRIHYWGILLLLKHFAWKWVGIITSEDDNAERELWDLSQVITSHGICIEFIMKISEKEEENRKRMAVVKKSTSQLQKHVKRLFYKDPFGNKISFNERGEVTSKYYLINWKVQAYEKKRQTLSCDVGILDTSGQEHQHLEIFEKYILWKTGKIPQALCNDVCRPGQRKAPNGGFHTCCYDCVKCSEGEVSNTTDSDNCDSCHETEWPDEGKVKCIPKTLVFLSYEEDIMAAVFSFISMLFLFILMLILGVFIVFRDTPIIRANNRNLSFLLLVSIMLTFLCVFLFLGRPVDITCMLRHTSFGIIFSVTVSSILAKTIMVCIAFKATKPGSSLRQCVGVKVSNSIVLMCSSVQVLINVAWLSISPPFHEFDMHSYPGKIIIQCNEGSVIAFYSVWGYMGILAAMSFVLAFMVRTLPDSFNEAKYITFSMLVFCSVWIAMIPAYLSTKGKDMVAVEIFAILASGAGIVGCLFFPKCYVLLMRPEMNSRRQLLVKK
ncbi:vomeronasal type-2 receptor 26-like [Pelodytes ibericus]